MAAEGPSPGLTASTLGAPLFLGGLVSAVGAIRLNEADHNHTGAKQLAKLAEAQGNLEFGLILAGSTLAVVLLAHLVGTWRARQHEVRLSHPSGLVSAGLVLLLLARHLWSAFALLRGWSGTATLDDPSVAVHALALLFISTLGVGLCALMAPASLLLGVFVRRFQSEPPKRRR